ncbi:MAG: hypothetical protein ACE5O2_03990 [Armatimonadota bacterium]
MRHRETMPMRSVATVVVLLSSAGAVVAQTPLLKSPRDGQVVRGIVALSATKPNPGEGWISYMLTGGQLEKPTLIAAVINPFTYNWDTRERQEGKRRFPDGRYTLVMTAHDPTSRVLAREEVAIEIQNSVTAPEVADGVRLEYKFERGASSTYLVTGEAELTLKSADKAYQAVVAPLAGVMNLTFTRTILGYSELDGGIVRNAPTEGVLEMEGVAPRLFPNLAKLFTIYQATNGVTKAAKKDDPRFGMGELYVALPSRVLRTGDTWESEMAIMPEFTKAKRQICNGRHTLEGFEWMHGEKCARIKSEYSYKGTLTLRPGTFDVAAETDMKGTQTMWFAYEIGRVLHVEEENKHDLTLDTSKFGGVSMAGGGMMIGAGMGMEGMGMMPGEGMMMPPGGAMPMEGAAGTMMPGGMMPMGSGGMGGSMMPAGEMSMMPGMAGTEGSMAAGMMGGAYGGASGKREIEAQYRVHIILDTGRRPGEIVKEASRRPRVHVAPAEKAEPETRTRRGPRRRVAPRRGTPRGVPIPRR